MSALQNLLNQVLAADINGELAENITAYPEAAAALEGKSGENQISTKQA